MRRSARRTVERARSMAAPAGEPPGHDEFSGQLDFLGEGVGGLLKLVDHVGGDLLEVLEELGVEVGVDGDLAADGEGLSLEGEKDFLDVLFRGEGASETHGGYGFVERAVGLAAGIGLGDSAAVEEAGLATVSESGVHGRGLGHA